MDHPNSSISVVQFIMCDDLLGEFEEVASEGDNDDEGTVAKVFVFWATFYLWCVRSFSYTHETGSY